jgi:cytochrome c biogenesis protein CcdA/thiol-disulfide isomerase/thioredoxin
MKKIILLLLLVLPNLAWAQDKPKLTLFYSPNCKACLEVKEDILPPLKEKYAGKIDWLQLDVIQDSESLSQLISLNKLIGKKEARTPSILIGNKLLVGLSEISLKLDLTIEESLTLEVIPLVLPQTNITEAFNKIPLFLIITSGLIDGINPCAFAVIVFFVSFLSVYGYRRRQILYVGSAYCLAVFIAYLLIGLGLFKFLYSISQIYIFIKGFYYLVAGLCFVMSLLSLRDYFRFKKTGSSDGAILQLPKFLKKKINLAIGSGLRSKEKKSPLGLILTAFSVGIVVSLLEAVCTGQVYVPVLVSILKYPGLRAKALFYLIVYNLMFIFPLIAIFILSFLGVGSKRFNDFLKKNIGKIKILMALLFLFLGLFLLGYEATHARIYPLIRKIVSGWIN